MRACKKDFLTNYEVLHRIWNDPTAKSRSDMLRDIFPRSVAKNEVVTREDDLRAEGFTGRLPSCLFKYRGFSLLCWSNFYNEYLIRHKLIDDNGLCLYSILKWK